MRFSLGRVLITGGLAVGVFGAVAVALGLHAALPPDILKVAAYKMVGIAAVGLIVAGAAVRRLELERRRGDPERRRELGGGAEWTDERDALPPADRGFERFDPRPAPDRSYVGEERPGRPRGP